MPNPLPDSLRKAIATYEAGKAMMAYMTPEFEEVVRVRGCAWVFCACVCVCFYIVYWLTLWTLKHLQTQHAHVHMHTQVSVCPFDLLTGYTLFVEDEDRGVNALMTRADMEAHMVCLWVFCV